MRSGTLIRLLFKAWRVKLMLFTKQINKGREAETNIKGVRGNL